MLVRPVTAVGARDIAALGFLQLDHIGAEEAQDLGAGAARMVADRRLGQGPAALGIEGGEVLAQLATGDGPSSLASMALRLWAAPQPPAEELKTIQRRRSRERGAGTSPSTRLPEGIGQNGISSET